MKQLFSDVSIQPLDPVTLMWRTRHRVFVGSFQVGCFYGPTFSAVQELVPPQTRATVVVFYILTLNLIGLGIGITAGGFMIDDLIGRGVASPYSWTLIAFTGLSMLCIPCFYLAGRRFQMDRERLYVASQAP